jgi:hypothetical protein
VDCDRPQLEVGVRRIPEKLDIKRRVIQTDTGHAPFGYRAHGPNHRIRQVRGVVVADETHALRGAHRIELMAVAVVERNDEDVLLFAHGTPAQPLPSPGSLGILSSNNKNVCTGLAALAWMRYTR